MNFQSITNRFSRVINDIQAVALNETLKRIAKYENTPVKAPIAPQASKPSAAVKPTTPQADCAAEFNTIIPKGFEAVVAENGVVTIDKVITKSVVVADVVPEPIVAIIDPIVEVVAVVVTEVINAAPTEILPVIDETGYVKVVKAPASAMAADLLNREQTFFEKKFHCITKELKFNSKWCSEKDHFGYLQNDKAVINGVKTGHQARCIDPNGRKLIITGTPLGPVVIFQFYSGGKGGVVTYDAPAAVEETGLIRSSGGITADNLEELLGSAKNGQKNIGKVLAELQQKMRK